jgi:hypothetical protein
MIDRVLECDALVMQFCILVVEQLEKTLAPLFWIASKGKKRVMRVTG